MKILASRLFLFPFFVSLFFGAPQSTLAAPQTLREWMKKSAARQAYGLYINGRKAGWMITETKLSKWAPTPKARKRREVGLESMEGFFRVRVPGVPLEQTTFTFRNLSVFALEGRGPILWSQERVKESGRERVHTLLREGSRYILQTDGKRKGVTMPRETLDSARQVAHWLSSKPKAGQVFNSYSLSLDDTPLDSPVAMRYVSRRQLVWGGVPITAHRVRMTMDGATIETDVKSDGTPLTGRMGGLIELRAEEEKLAKNLDAQGVDLLAASSIRVDKHLGDPRRLQSLKLDVSGLGDFRLPSSPRQQLQGGQLMLQADAAEFSLPRSLTAVERSKYLNAETNIQSDSATIKRLSKQIIGSKSGVMNSVASLQNWVYRNLKKSMSSNASSALDVLQNRAGDCTEHTLLFVALCRTAKIPSREVGGLMYVDGTSPMFGWHAWAEIHDGTRWVSVDPTWNEVWVDAAHIKFSEGSSDMAWINVMGRLKLTVADFAIKP